MKTQKIILPFFLVILFFNGLSAQLVADTGGDVHFCTDFGNDDLIIGGEPTAYGGVEPYIYEWSIEPYSLYPGSNIIITTSMVLNDSTLANPNVLDFTSRESFKFKLKVTDDIGQMAYDSCIVSFSSFVAHDAFVIFEIEQGDSVFISLEPNIYPLFDDDSLSYSWTPSESLSDANLEKDFWAFPDTSTWYYVMITDRFGCKGQALDPCFFVNVQTLGIDEIELPKISIFPNPTKDIIYIENKNKTLIDKIYISDLSGKIIIEERYNYGTSSIDISGLPKGFYFISFYSDEEKVYETKVIRH